MPLPYIGGALSRNVRDADELAYQIAATVAFGLVQVYTGCFCHACKDRLSLVLLHSCTHDKQLESSHPVIYLARTAMDHVWHCLC